MDLILSDFVFPLIVMIVGNILLAWFFNHRKDD